MWTHGAAVCSLVVAVPACTDEERLPHRPRLPPATETPADLQSATPPSDPVDRGFEALSWASLPVLGQSVYRKTSSYDRDESSSYLFVQPGNKDFNNWLAVCGDRPAIGYSAVVGGATCSDGLEGYLIAAADDGPGYVSRIFYTHEDFDPNAKDAETIRVFVDDLETPAYEGKLSDWGKAGSEPFVAPLAGRTSGATVSYVPISYANRLRVLLDDLSPSGVYYYGVETRSSEPTAAFVPSALDTAKVGERLAHEVAEGKDRAVWIDAIHVLDPGEVASVLGRKDSGTVEVLQITVDDPSTEALASLELRAAWDDASDFAIRLPLDALFGQRPALASFETLPMGVRLTQTTVELRLSLPMPFSTRARIDVANTGTVSRTVRVHVEGVSNVVPDAGRLHAALQDRRAPMAASDRFPVAQISGKGRYLGSVVFLEGKGDSTLPAPNPLNFLEGDDVLELDGRAAGHGTGTEDFLDGGWYFADGCFETPFAALLYVSGPSQTKGQVTALRWQTPADVVECQSSLLLGLEYGAHQPSTAVHYESVAFSYQSR